MSISVKLKEYLDNNNVDYEVSPHKEVFTAQELAACLHIPGKVMTKVVMIKVDGKDVMTVIPACRRINISKLKEMFKSEEVRIEEEEEFKNIFPECDVGAMPPFGNLYGIDVYVDSSLADDEYIMIQGGNYREVVRLKYEDFARLAKPQVQEFTSMAA